MAQKIGIFVDVSNLYYCVAEKFKGKKLKYKAYHDFIADLGDVVIAKAYGAQLHSEAAAFIKKLVIAGFEPVYKEPRIFTGSLNNTPYKRKADWDIGITVDTIRQMEKLDIIVIGTADGDFNPLISMLTDNDKMVIVFACNISCELKKVATKTIEIPESLLYETSNNEKRNRRMSNIRRSNDCGL